MLKERFFLSTKLLKVLPPDTREESSSMKPFLKFRIAKKEFRKKIRNLQGFFLIFSGSVAFFYETLKGSYIFTKPFFAMRNFKKGFVEDSSRVSGGRNFKSLVETKNRSLSILSHLNTILNLLNFFEGFGKVLIFLECRSNS